MVDEQALAGKVVLVTGANSGIGKAAALDVARMGATTLLACRNAVKGREAEAELRRLSGNDAVRNVELNLADLRSVEQCADDVIASTDGIDVLINNAGGTVPSRRLTAQGFEETFAGNYLGHYALTRLLLAHLRRDPQARVVNVSSIGHKFARGFRWDDPTFERGYSMMRAYSNAKLAQVLFTRELAHRYGESGVYAFAVHPGFVGSNFYSSTHGGRVLSAIMSPIASVFAKSSEQGAETVVYVATSDDATRVNGGYWADGKPATPSKAASSDDSARRLWELSERMVTDAGFTLPPG